MDTMLAASQFQRVSPRPSFPLDSDELPRSLSFIARIFVSVKRTINLSNDPPGRSTKRQRVRLTDMPREGLPSPSRPSPSSNKSSHKTTDNTSSVCHSITGLPQPPARVSWSSDVFQTSSREKPTKRSPKEGKQGRDRGARPSSVAVASAALPSAGAPAHKIASRPGASPAVPLGRPCMPSPEESAYVQARIYQRRVELINRLMAIITPCLDNTLSAMEAACDGEGPLLRRTGVKRGSGSISASGSAQESSMGQKRGKTNQSHESDGEDDGDQRSGGRINKRTKTTTERGKKFACPYYKRDPGKFGHTRTCSGPGWDEVHRIK